MHNGIAKIGATNTSPSKFVNAKSVDMDGFQTITRRSPQTAHASSSNDQLKNQKKDNNPELEKGKLQTNNQKSKSKAPPKGVQASSQEEPPPPHFNPPKGSNLNIILPTPKPKSPKPLDQTKAKAVSPSFNRFSILGDPSLYKDPGSSSLSPPIHMASSEPMDAYLDQDDLLEVEDVIEVDLDDGATARFLTRNPLSPQVNPVSSLEPEWMESTPSLVS
ncbi:hypothetical protein L6452_35603 [Arctium lappa]|uniref:Uncharacterized protein n=1 Tax=Arctium lappa TaxID=4217 RepID=A0ACB8Y8E7_ARCLA|nr:hypothetical protein L6452_35603 [Arctium lappa]